MPAGGSAMKFAVLTAILSALMLLGLRELAMRLNWLDQPDERKAHALAIPAVGGLAWCFALVSISLVSGLGSYYPYLITALVLICILGAIDDRAPLPSVVRLLIQALAVVLAFWQSPILSDFGELFWPGSSVHVGVLAWPITVFACVGVINAINMIDGMDGLLGMLLLGLFSVILTLAVRSGQTSLALSLGLAIAALVPFLFLNVRTPWLARARVFFGDAGSMAAGLFVAWLLVVCSQPSLGLFKPVYALYLLAVPLIDTVSLMLRRIQSGRSPFSPDQEHLHHLLQRASFSVTQSMGVMLGIALSLQLMALLLAALGAPESVALILFLLLALTYHFWIVRAVRNQGILGRSLARAMIRA